MFCVIVVVDEIYAQLDDYYEGFIIKRTKTHTNYN